MSDKYAAFVWPAYAVTALVFAWMTLDTALRARRWRRRAEQLEAGQQEAGQQEAGQLAAAQLEKAPPP